MAGLDKPRIGRLVVLASAAVLLMAACSPAGSGTKSPQLSPSVSPSTQPTTSSGSEPPHGQASPGGSFVPIGSVSTARADHTSTLLGNGQILVAGGLTTPQGTATLQTAGLLDPATGSFVEVPPMTTARENHSATLLGDGRVLLAGGYDFHDGAGSVQSSAEIYDPKTNSFAPTGSMGSPREGQTATRLRDGLVLIAGGADSTTSAVATAELYDPKTGSFSPTNPMSTPRYLATATLLANGKVLVIGGLDGPTLTDRSLDSAELYDPATGAFELTRSMSTARASQTATLLPDGRVAIIGGRGDVAPVPWAELYNPKTGIFTISGSMTLPRFGQAASLLPDGRILVAGGSRTVGGGSATYLAAAEVFDPRTGVFSPTGWLSTPRFAPTTTLVSNGRVLVIGGWVDAGTTSRIAATLESYDPATGTFTPVTPPGSAQAGSGFAIALGTASGTSN